MNLLTSLLFLDTNIIFPKLNCIFNYYFKSNKLRYTQYYLLRGASSAFFFFFILIILSCKKKNGVSFVVFFSVVGQVSFLLRTAPLL